MNLKRHLNEFLKILRTRYPHVKTQLEHDNTFQLLIATMLSAQCTDRQVNRVTRSLFQNCRTPEDFAKAPVDRLESLIHSTGYYRVKAKRIKNCCRRIIDEFDGKVPGNMDDLIRLPGVGRKTANVLLSVRFGIPGIVVDTHVARISRRVGLTNFSDPVKIEFDLMKKIPEIEWNDLCLRLIYFGRDICTAVKPGCDHCPVSGFCEFFKTK